MLRADAARINHWMGSARHEAERCYSMERERTVADHLDRMPLDALKTASEGRLLLAPIEAAGFGTVASVRSVAYYHLQALPGVGPRTATQVVSAAQQVEGRLREAVRVRFDVDSRPYEQTMLLASLANFDLVRHLVGPISDEMAAVIGTVDAFADSARLETQRFRRFFSSSQAKQQARSSVAALAEMLARPGVQQLITSMNTVNEAMASRREPVDVWRDFLDRPVLYNGLLIEISGLSDDEAAHGYLPADLIEKIQAFRLDTSLLDVSLRGYQAFGAKFALVQERSILGDEMGLGKTIEALAVLSHLRAEGYTHFMVISPASVLANWRHETRRHTRIEQSWLLHGQDRNHNLNAWIVQGGVAFTTFDTLRTLPNPAIEIDAIVVDEAHYAKNPEAKRTLAVRGWLSWADTVLLMSGTPMENRVEEFRTLVDHVRPDVAGYIRSDQGVAGAEAFRRTVAPVYLRRNQADVLNELPPKIETADWLTLEGPAAGVYRQAVAAGNFMAMRRAAFLTEQPRDSPKLSRLLEIADEALENDRKVIVFSYFRDVIDVIHRELGIRSVGRLTGSIPAHARQQLVDDFSNRSRPAVLVSQIEAGGVGLNIQAASVVILTEPQWKPSIEAQAVARCHRLGQVRPVEVHRLLTEESVDERMIQLLAHKSALFAEYVQKSALKDATPEAIDITDDVRTTEVANQAEQERRIVELEQRRLGLAVR